jgi:dynein light chain Tctex-type 1
MSCPSILRRFGPQNVSPSNRIVCCSCRHSSPPPHHHHHHHNLIMDGLTSSDYSESGPQTFDYDEVKLLIEQAIEPVLGKQVYQAKRIHDWTSTIVESVLKSLQQSSKPFKYVVTCIIMQKNGAGLHTASTCFW